MGRRGGVLSCAAALLIATTGCGSEGVVEGATASVYVTVPLCAEARAEREREGARAGEVRLRVMCLPKAETLAAVGAGARQATEDSATIAYIGTPNRKAVEFSETILEEAGIARLSADSGAIAMDRLTRAVNEAGDASNLRQALWENLG